jgi:spectinomycin phosphotransferase
VKELPDGFEATELIEPLALGWSFEAETLDYAPVGFGSYHWVATDAAGRRVFVTVDDLDRKPALGHTRGAAFDGLTRAFASAVALSAAGLAFVCAPEPTREGDPLRRIGDRHTVAVFPFVEGEAGRQFEYDAAEVRAAVVTMLARLHEATSAVESVARRIDLQLPGRSVLESALREINDGWTGGPFSEPSREALASRATDVAELLELFDRLRDQVTERGLPWVVTHGEPHPVNVMQTHTGRVLIDWDTVAIGLPERDLWMVIREDGGEAAIYEDVTGHRPDRLAIDFFDLTWDLADLADFIDVVRAPHRDTEDTQKAFNGLVKCAGVRHRWAALLD